jgi:hypothetical protein
MGEDMMRELAEPIAALKALQVLILDSKSPPTSHPGPRVFVLWRQVHFYTLQATKSAPPDAPRLRELSQGEGDNTVIGCGITSASLVFRVRA